jgi:hypothetical protein
VKENKAECGRNKVSKDGWECWLLAPFETLIKEKDRKDVYKCKKSFI